MAITIQNAIDLAKIYVDDNHKATDGWKEPADWLSMIRPELLALYRKWVRESLLAFSNLDASFTGPTYTFPAADPPLAIVGVAQQNGSSFRLIQPAMSQFGRAPYWESGIVTPALTWTSEIDVNPDGNGDPTWRLQLHPPDTAAGYIVRYIKFPDTSALDKFIILPVGYEDYLALRLARKALASEGASSQAIEKLIVQAEADIRMDSFANTQGNAPKIRIVRPYNKQRIYSSPSNTWPLNPAFWFYP